MKTIDGRCEWIWTASLVFFGVVGLSGGAYAQPTTVCIPSPTPASAQCPGDCPECLDVCEGQVCITYNQIEDAGRDVIEGPVTIEFEESKSPGVGPASEPSASPPRVCLSSFGRTTGPTNFCSYTSTTGTIKRLTAAGFAITDRCPADLLALVRGGTHCSTWTQAQRDRFRELCVPFVIEGWEIAWECQQAEPGTGFSVTSIATPPILMTELTCDFSINLMCDCNGSNTLVVPVRLSLPTP